MSNPEEISMTKAQHIASLAEVILQPILAKSGIVLYSDAKSLQSCPIYLLGYNPGGSPEDQSDATISSSLKDLPTKQTNNYLDEEWTTASGRSWSKGEAPLQRRVVRLLQQLGFNPRNVPCSNLIFVRSVDVSGISLAMADLCWKVHEQILEIVMPKLILVFGNSTPSPYQFLKEKYSPLKEELFPSGHGNWMCRSFKTNGLTVVGLPHLSRYSIIGKHNVIQWIKEQTAL